MATTKGTTPPMTEFHALSMTGYGRAQDDNDMGRLIVEIRTVNNRYQDISPSLPRELSGLELPLRRALKDAIPRGKIDCRVRFYANAESQNQAVVHPAVAAQYIEQLNRLSEAGVAGEPTMEIVTRLPGVIEVIPAECDEAKLWQQYLRPLLDDAIEKLTAERLREGKELAAHLKEIINRVRWERSEIDKSKDEVVEKFRKRLMDRIAQIENETTGKFEPGRLEAEVALYAERADINEELTRLEVHLDRFSALLKNNDGVIGKNLDFLVQEIYREVNTICSKSRDTSVTQHALSMKTLVEQMREQIQNIQ